MNRRMNRREFIQDVAASTVASGLYVNPSWGADSDSPNEKLNIAVVGVANKGGHNVEQLKSQNIVALCDIDANYLAKSAQKYPKARQYRDYRRMLEAEYYHIDAVVVSTADHNHAPPSSIALYYGKHVYCENPLTTPVREARYSRCIWLSLLIR